MSNVRTKITALLLILSTCRTGYCQLTLEDLFLTNRYAAKDAGDIQLLHTQPCFARLTADGEGNSILFFNRKNEKTGKWKLQSGKLLPAQGSTRWGGLVMSNTDKYFLVRQDCEQLYRRSFSCSYAVGDDKGRLTPLSDGHQFYPAFSPDDKKIAFVKDNNLFYKDINTGNEVAVTQDGKWNKIINGKSDWAYEEELELTRAYEWNPKSDKIAYLKFDETHVKEYSIPMYYDLQYPNNFTYKYPKAGEENPKVSLWLYDLKSKKTRQLPLPFPYEYMPRIYWNAGGDEVIAMLLNRHQDSLQLIGYNIKTKKIRLLYTETDSAYVEMPETLEILSDNSFIISSEKDGYNHLYHYNTDGKLLHQLTKGSFEVKETCGIDEKNKLVYYQSNESLNPGISYQRHLFSVSYETLEKKQLTYGAGTSAAKFSSDFSFYIRKYSSLRTPPLISIESVLNDTSVILENNQFLLDSLIPFLPEKQIGKILTRHGNLNTYDILPPDSVVLLSAGKPTPDVFFIYGGPGNEDVVDEWNSGSSNLFLYYLAQEGIKITGIDPRGSGGKGAAFQKSTYLNLGKYETEDILEYAKRLKGSKSTDSARLGIFGWSYGGYMAVECLLEGNGIFKTAIAAAPVTSWKLYNTIYTERYMRTHRENPTGYYHFNPVVSAGKLSGNLLLIHGTADDNVHFQHTVQLINALNAANKSYQLYLYPDSMHGVSGKKNRYDLYTKIFRFLKEKL